jgi:hypothetical protein
LTFPEKEDKGSKKKVGANDIKLFFFFCVTDGGAE